MPTYTSSTTAKVKYLTISDRRLVNILKAISALKIDGWVPFGDLTKESNGKFSQVLTQTL